MKMPKHTVKALVCTSVSLTLRAVAWADGTTATATTTPAAPVISVLANSSFETLDDRGRVAVWAGVGTPNVKLVKENENHYVTVAKNDANYRGSFNQKLTLDPSWKTLKVSARMKASKVEAGAQSWETPRIVLAWQNAEGKATGYANGPALAKDSDWTVVSITITVPEGARVLAVEPGMFGKGGEVSFDDVTVEANPAPDIQ